MRNPTLTSMMKTALSILSISLLSGCASQLVPVSASRLVPQNRIIATSPLAAGSLRDGGHLILVRDHMVGGKGFNLRLSINDVVVADLEHEERYEVFLREGDYILSIIPNPNRFSQWTKNEIALSIKKGETYKLRASCVQGNYFLQRSSLSDK